MQEPCRLSADAEFSAADVLQAVRRFLIYDIEPVMVEQMGVIVPGKSWPVLGGVFIRVAFRDADRQVFGF